MTQKLFLSYKREDNKDGFVEKLYHALKNKGYDVWWDMQSMPMRQLTFLTEIRDAVASHDRLILVGSQLAYQSNYVKAEFDYALSICKPVHPILRADDYSDIPSSLAQFDAPDFRDDVKFDAAFDHLLRHLQADAAPLGKIHGTRPALPAWYIERDNIMDELDNKVLIDANQPVVVTSKQQVSALHGMGGIGKTIVASAFCQRCKTRRYFTGGVFWITLGKKPDITQRQADIGYIFGDDRKEYLSPEIGFNRLQHILADKKVLLVLDDVWEKQHAEFFRVTGNLNRVLMTSRSRRLVTQLGAVPTKLDSLSVDEGIRLFDERLNRLEYSEHPHDATERKIVKFLNGHTLAVSLAAALLNEESEWYAPKLLQRLQKRRESDNPFFTLEMSEDDKNENLELCLSLSYDGLSNDLQSRFRALGVLAPEVPFREDIIQSIWDDEDEEYCERALRDLHNAGLLQKNKNRLYEQHTVLRAYAIALLKRENEYNLSLHKYFDKIASVSTTFKTLPPEEWHKLQQIMPHFFYVGDKMSEISQTVSIFHETIGFFAYGIMDYLIRSPEIRRSYWIKQGIKSADQLENYSLKASLLNGLGSITDSLGDKDQAIKYYNQSLEIFQISNHKQGESAVLNNLGLAYHALGDYENALSVFNLSLKLKDAFEDEYEQATVINNIGLSTLQLGNYDKALTYFIESLRLSKLAKDKICQAHSLNNLGQVYERLNKKHKAIKYYRKAISLYKRVGDKFSETISLYNIANLYLSLGNRKRAIEYLEKCVELEKVIGHPDLAKDRDQLDLLRQFENEGFILIRPNKRKLK